MNYLISGPVTQQVIDMFLTKAGEDSGSGGHSVFLGQVRADRSEGREVTAIEYSAYEGMVNAEAEKIKGSILEKFSDVRSVGIIHSTGIVKAGEISLFVIVSAGHRKQSLEACSLTVEMIKERLPVWKKEIYDDESHTWK